VSLTSFPPRIAQLHLCIHSLFAQNVLPNKIVLYLSKSQFPHRNKDLPENLLQFIPYGLEIEFVDVDYKSFNKLYYSLKKYPKARIITVDDDYIYRKNVIKLITKMGDKHKDCCIGCVIHRFNKEISYRKLSWQINF
jgi:hypothetical protein